MSDPLAIERVQRINPMSNEAYRREGPGIGAGDGAIDWLYEHCGVSLTEHSRILEIGFGKGDLLMRALQIGCASIYGVETCSAAMNDFKDRVNGSHPNLKIKQLDVSHSRLPFMENSVNFAFCLETIEHLTNPYHMVAEVKRVLVPGGWFVLAFPRPESNLGYNEGKHAHVYPGFLQQQSFEMFMRQLYFKQVKHVNNGDSAWYAFRNYKGPGVMDTFYVIAGNFAEENLFGVLESYNPDEEE